MEASPFVEWLLKMRYAVARLALVATTRTHRHDHSITLRGRNSAFGHLRTPAPSMLSAVGPTAVQVEAPVSTYESCAWMDAADRAGVDAVSDLLVQQRARGHLR